MTNRILAIILLHIAWLAVFADDSRTNLAEWSKDTSENGAELVNGVKMYRQTMADGQLIISDFF